MTTARNYDVAVIGGGIVGCAAAYYLAKRGLDVVLLEKGEIAGEQSGRNWGFVRQQNRDPREIPLMAACIRMWRGLEADLDADMEWRQGGLLYVASDEAKMAAYEAWMAHARDYQLDSRLVSAREAAELLPGMARDWVGGILTPSDGQADPVKATAAFAAAAARLGAEVRTGCVVEAIETAGRKVVGVRTEAGPVRAATVLLAAGAWTGRILRTLGVSLPQLCVRSTVLRTAAVPEKTRLGVWCPEIGFRQCRDGSFNVAPGAWSDHDLTLDSLRYGLAFRPAQKRYGDKFQFHFGRPFLEDLATLVDGAGALARRLRRHRVLDPAPDRRKVDFSIAAFRDLFPEFKDIGVHGAWAGVIEATPDEVPVLGALPGLDNLAVATGFSGHGFGIGPIAGRLMAELIADGRTSLDISAFRFARFAEGRTRAPDVA